MAMLASAAWGAEPSPPSLEFLEYLAELVKTEDGELIDPLDMADEVPRETSVSSEADKAVGK